MEWTPHFESGRGSRKEKGNRGKQIAQAKENGELKRNEKKTAVVRKLVSFLREQNAPQMDKDGLAQWLFSHPELPSGWDRSRLCSKAGKPIKNAAVVIDGEGLRLTRFFATRRREKAKEKAPVRSLGDSGMTI